jgi:hypothetical protein
VYRKWLPRSARWVGIGFVRVRNRGNDRDDGGTQRQGSGWDWIPDPPIDDLPFVAIILAVVVALVLAWFFVFPALIFIVDLLLVFLIAVTGIATRVLFRRPWTIEAHTTDAPPERRGWAVVGWRASSRALELAADAIRTGQDPIWTDRHGLTGPLPRIEHDTEH